jgi:D-arabinose 1-dehydrogenase-like Zn-dependent alcohol dehydrogenase
MALPNACRQAAFKELVRALAVEEVPPEMPEAGEILVKVQAADVCHPDLFAQHNTRRAGFPVVPGHDVIGKVAALGNDIRGWENQRPDWRCVARRTRWDLRQVQG